MPTHSGVNPSFDMSAFGLRKSGKTSTIYAIQRRAKVSGCRTLVIDCQDPAIHAKRFGLLLQYIVAAARQELNLKKLDINLGSEPDQISENFRRLMNDSLSAAATDVLLIFDEIENISPKTAASPHWRESTDALLFWQTARSFFQNPRKHKLTFCFVGTNPHLFELSKIHEIDNPVYLFAPKTFLPMLSLPETTEMVTRLGYFMGMDFGPNVIAHLHQRFGGHPFFIRQVCSQVHRSISTSRPRTISIAACKDAERDAGADIQGYMSEILTTLKTFYPDEHTMIEYLAKGDRVNFNDLAAYDPAYIEHLIGYGLVVRRGDDYEFGFDAIKEAVEKRLIKSASADLEDRWSEISKRRNRIEEEIRVALFHWSTKFNATEWAETVKKCVTTKRLGELGPINHREAFSKNSSPLYWIELLKFVDISGKFESNESSARIVSAMNIINAHRADAHAKAIAEQHYQDVLKALDFLEDVFLPPP